MSPQRSTRTRRTALLAAAHAWGPFLLLAAIIFVASAQPKLAPPPGTDSPVYMSGVMPIFPDVWDLVVKKSSHVLGYGLLALLALYGLTRSGRPPRRAMLLAVLLAVGYGLTDELHQSFVTGRHASPVDVGIDAFGAIVAVLVAPRIVARRRASA